MSKKNELDQYYTNPLVARECFGEFIATVPHAYRQTILEPSAGAGAFMVRPEVIGVDLEPNFPGVIEKDFFNINSVKNTSPSTLAVLGNPPFGFAASLAVRFFNHAATLANTIGFVVPQSFMKTSVQNKLSMEFHLVYERVLEDNSFLLDGNPYDVPCVFQIWIKRKSLGLRTPPAKPVYPFEFTTKDKANIAVRRVGGRAGQVLEGLEHSKSSTYFIKASAKVIKALRNINLDIASRTAGVKSISKDELATLTNEVLS